MCLFGSNQLFQILHAEGNRFFHKHMFPGLHSGQGICGMVLIGGADKYGIHIGIFYQLIGVGIGSCVVLFRDKRKLSGGNIGHGSNLILLM